MKKETSTWIACMILSLFFWVLLPAGGAAQAPDSFFVAGIHPAASLQPTITGKQLMILFPWKGKLYSGYGDYGANTGPINIYSFTPDSLSFKYEAQANTEAVYNYRAVNGMLYAPAIDRKSNTMPGDYIKMDSNGAWANYNFGSNSTHTFDAARLNDSVIFMTGSQNNNAVVWKSTNNARTWNKILTEAPISGVAGDFARFYFGGLYNGKLYVQARDYYGPMHANSKVYDGTAWTTGPSLFPSFNSLGWRPEVFAGKMVYRSWEPGRSAPLRSFDGVNNSWVNSLWVYDCFIDSTYYYALVDSGFGVKNIRRTTDLIIWENLLVAPGNSRSMAILNDKLFIGTSDSKILQYTKPVSLLGTRFPIVNSNRFGVQIYPNPAKNEFYVKGSFLLPAVIELYDIVGRKILTQNITSNNQKINAAGFSRGVYFYKVTAADKKQGSGKIIVQ